MIHHNEHGMEDRLARQTSLSAVKSLHSKNSIFKGRINPSLLTLIFWILHCFPVFVVYSILKDVNSNWNTSSEVWCRCGCTWEMYLLHFGCSFNVNCQQNRTVFSYSLTIRTYVKKISCTLNTIFAILWRVEMLAAFLYFCMHCDSYAENLSFYRFLFLVYLCFDLAEVL